MTPRDFCYWLQGFYEIKDADRSPIVASPVQTISNAQAEVIRNHLNLVFKHVLDAQYPAETKGALQAVHDGDKPGSRFQAMC
jgi:hypothetical protein